MILKINLITACLIFSWHITFSQTHQLTLENQRVDLSKRSYNVTKVIDERSDKTNIGWVQRGMVNAKVNANFANPFETEIRNFLNRNLVSNEIKPNIQIIIRTLKISEKTTFMSIT
jgi:hypothetical protein